MVLERKVEVQQIGEIVEWKKIRSLLSNHYDYRHEIDVLTLLCGLDNFHVTRKVDGYDGYKVSGTAESRPSCHFFGSPV